MVASRYERAIVRNLHEVGLARFERAALLGLVHSRAKRDWNFFYVSYLALFNDLIAHSIRVLDRNSKSASFWYLHRSNSGAIDMYVAKRGINWQLLNEVSDRLNIIRDGTHFHIDHDGVMNPKAIWTQAGLTGNDLGRCLSYLWLILNHLHAQHFGRAFEAPKYDGTDVPLILAAARAAGIVSQ